ncbi:BspA family leucine-rich repeat surface protein [Pleomorphovibrio marinus]|uniref:BspA family leucine-rich repeat surface protein n=1 Tax=Pleomorphovibrio marinus TaxID=2164132 RepID=UPI000E0BF151|nr:BspA family leucine-rich repeat surface protein [Pleomorphovibrio marinus]
MRKYIYHFVILSIIFSSCETEDELDPENTKFYLYENGVTCMCPDTSPGDRGSINGLEYESVDNDLIRQRRDEGFDMTKLCTSLVTDLAGLFEESDFNQPIGGWDVSGVTDMKWMFFSTPFNQPIGHWDVSSVLDMTGMFENSLFNQPLGDWDVRNVQEMVVMFAHSQFNQNISSWCVTNIPSEPQEFSFSSPLTSENKPKWGTCPD